jgi:hypothetical protein
VARSALFASVLSALALAGTASAAPAPIVGTWRAGTIQVQVSTTDRPGIFVGKLLTPLKVSYAGGACTMPVGYGIWSFGGSGTSYSGSLVLVAEDCATPKSTGDVTWTIVERAGSVTVNVCTRSPGSSVPSCQEYDRVGAAPTTTAPTPAPSASGSIEGTWLGYFGTVQIARTGPGLYAGKVVAPSTATRCKERKGATIWKLSDSGSRYQGTALIWDSRKSACKHLTATATWTLRNGKLTFVNVAPVATGETSTATLVRR